ncbi:hypothetical protein JCM21900_005184 [Sporobolomyces salmonicolor]
MIAGTWRVKSPSRRTVAFKRSSNFPVATKHPAPSLDHLRRRAAFLLAHSHAPRTRYKYALALKKWTVFTVAFGLPFTPSTRSLVLFVAYISEREKHVAPVLSGLAFHFAERLPSWTTIYRAPLVAKAVRAARLLPRAPVRRAPLFAPTTSTLSSSFGALMRLGELVAEPVVAFRDSFSFHLPYHKGNKYFEGSTVGIVKEGSSRGFNFVRLLHAYVVARDRLVPSSCPFLFARLDGSQPTRRWFLRRLAAVDPQLTGHSLRSGGATFLANAGVAGELIMRLGRWSSSAFRVYLRDHGSVALALSRHQLHRT